MAAPQEVKKGFKKVLSAMITSVSIKTFVMRLAVLLPQRYRVRAVAVNFFFSFIRPLFSWLFVFLLIPDLIFYSTVRGLTKFKTRRSLSN